MHTPITSDAAPGGHPPTPPLPESQRVTTQTRDALLAATIGDDPALAVNLFRAVSFRARNSLGGSLGVQDVARLLREKPDAYLDYFRQLVRWLRRAPDAPLVGRDFTSQELDRAGLPRLHCSTYRDLLRQLGIIERHGKRHTGYWLFTQRGLDVALVLGIVPESGDTVR